MQFVLEKDKALKLCDILSIFPEFILGTYNDCVVSFQIDKFKKADLARLDILVGGEKEEALSRIVNREQAFQEGKKAVQKLKSILPPQQFDISLQAALGGKVIARETVKAKRKDVTAPLYGGDVTRKKKLLQVQKKGKKKLKQKGRVRIGTEVFLEMFKLS